VASGEGELGVPSRSNSRNCEYSLAKDDLSWTTPKRGPFSENLEKGNLQGYNWGLFKEGSTGCSLFSS